MCAAPATFMSGVSATYILMADEGFRIAGTIAYPVGAAFALGCALLFFRKARRMERPAEDATQA